MASIRKRGNSYLIVVSMSYDYKGTRIKPRQKTVRPPEGLTPKQGEKWLQEQAVLFERSCRDTPEAATKPITLAAYIDLWLREIAPGKLAKATTRRNRQNIVRILPALGHYKLTELRPETFGAFTRSSAKPSAPKPKSHPPSTPLKACTLRCAAFSPMPWRVAFCVTTPPGAPTATLGERQRKG